jgi:hypothetical protein
MAAWQGIRFMNIFSVVLTGSCDFIRLFFLIADERVRRFVNRVNPIQYRLVSSAMEWPYSSFRRYVAAGVYPADWGQGAIDFDGVGCE